MGVLLQGFRLHCAVMIMMYMCQGLAQGTLQIMILLILQEHPELSAADQATLALPMYSFSLKFLWAPVVDRYYRQCGCCSRRRRSCKQLSPPCAGYHCLEESPTKAGASTSITPEASTIDASAVATSPQAPRHVSTSSRARYSLFHRLHRRVQWVVALDLIMGLTYAWLCHVGNDAYLEAIVKDRTVFWQFFFVLCILSFANATQDVAVDAWAVEGLDPSHVPTAGMLQLVGVMTGVSLANMFVPLRSRFPEIFTLPLFFLVCGALCGVCAALAAFLAWHRRLFNEHRRAMKAAELRCNQETDAKAPQTKQTYTGGGLGVTPDGDAGDGGVDSDAEEGLDHHGIVQTLREIFATEGLRELVTLYVTRGWPLAVFQLVVSRLISMRVVTAGAVARYRIYSTLVQVAVAAYASVPLLRHVKASRVMQYISGFDFLLNIVAAVCFVAVAAPAAAGWFGLAVVLPITVLIFGVGALAFVANVSLQGRFAHLFPRDVGGVLSLLAAISNMGHHLPATICLYAASLVVQFCTWYTGRDTTYATYYATKHDMPAIAKSETSVISTGPASPKGHTTMAMRDAGLSPYWVKMDVIVCSLFFFGTGVILRYAFLVPSSNRLTQITTEADANRAGTHSGESPTEPLLHI